MQVSAESEAPPQLPATFGEYLRLVSPPSYSFEARHFKLITEAMDAITRGEIDRLALFMPPRHGKTSTVTVPYPAYRLERDATTRVLVTGHNERLARKFSRQTRNLLRRRIDLASDKFATDEWETIMGGGLTARGVSNPPTGFGFNVILIDDPIRSREEAESLNYRDKIFDWYTDDLYTRREPGAAIILICTRWHHDDLAARAIASEASRWHIIKLPALAEKDDPLGRKPGQALWPERFDEAELLSTKKVQTKKHGSYSFEALYQQNPTPRDGDFFKVTKITTVPLAPDGLFLCRAWDFAATDKGGDWTVGVLMGYDEKTEIYYVLDVVREQFASEERDALIKKTAGEDPKGTIIYLPQDPGQAGKSQIVAMTKMLRGYTVKSENVTGPKPTRADPLASQVNVGAVKFVEAWWNAVVIDEMIQFPLGAHDDIVDAMADAFTTVTTSGLGIY